MADATIAGEQYLIACIVDEKRSQLRVLDIQRSRTFLVIELPYQVSAISYIPPDSILVCLRHLCVLFAQNNECFKDHTKFRNILAVGTKGGRVLLLDLFPYERDNVCIDTGVNHAIDLSKGHYYSLGC